MNLTVLLGAVCLSAVGPGEIKANEHNFVSGSARIKLAQAGYGHSTSLSQLSAMTR